MKKFWFSLSLTIITSLSYAQEAKVWEIDLNGKDLESFHKDFQTPLKTYFSQLQDAQVIDSVFHSTILKSMNFAPLGRLKLLPLREIDCPAVFCKDIALQKALNKELQQNRLMLVSNPFAGFSGVTLEQDQPAILPIAETIGGDHDHDLAIIGISPDLTIDILEHELFHTRDYKNQKLKAKLASIKALLNAKYPKGYKGIESYIYETRAYTFQQEYVANNTRETEYTFNDSKLEIYPKEKYVESKSFEIRMKMRFIQSQLNDVLKRPELSSDEIESLKRMVDEALKMK